MRHIPPGVLSFTLILSAYFIGRKAGSRLAGVIMIVYGLLATIAGILFLSLILIVTSTEILIVRSIIAVGGIVALIAGITSIILGVKIARKPKLKVGG